MKVFAVARMFALLLAGLFLGRVPAGAQNLVLIVTASTNSIIVSNSVTYTINLTNQTGLVLQNVFVTNTPSAPVAWSALSSQGTISTNSTSVLFNLGTLAIATNVQMSLTFSPGNAGFLTNTITVGSTTLTNIQTTNVVTQVILPQADLAVGIAGSATVAFPGDQFTYGVTVTNRGPNDASNVILSNTLPAGVAFISISPVGQAFTQTNSAILLNLGVLTNGAFRSFSFRVQSTNAGSLNFSTTVSSSTPDTNAANNTASTNLVISSFTGQLIATNASTMTYNPQTGLMEQTIKLANIGTNSVASARVMVSGLTNRLYNAVGTNSGKPFVVYGAALDPGQSVNLLMEYFVPTRLPITIANTNYTAVGIAAVNLTPPNGTNGSFIITQIVRLTGGNMLVEFQSIPGRTYTIVYGDSLGSSNSFRAAQPSIVAPADRVQWIDDGPPKTISVPASASARFYRVLLNP